MDSNTFLNLMRNLFEEHGISEVVVNYNGGGDSGSYNFGYTTLLDGTQCNVEGSQSEEDFEEGTPIMDIELKNTPYIARQWNGRTNNWEEHEDTRDISFHDLCIEMAEHFVDINHGGWANSEGGYGTVTIRMERDGIEALANATRRRIVVLNEHADYIQSVEESENTFFSDAEE